MDSETLTSTILKFILKLLQIETKKAEDILPQNYDKLKIGNRLMNQITLEYFI